ncbi:UNVERIFIED_CONTAM: hypothetical protein GTU68_021945 [Idotea baltica]|nr:hypothetical protein [Idotea baltica]
MKPLSLTTFTKTNTKTSCPMTPLEYIWTHTMITLITSMRVMCKERTHSLALISLHKDLCPAQCKISG